MKNRTLVLSLLLGWLSGGELSAKIELPEIVGDNMVLQQRTEVRLWGTALPGATVTAMADWQQTLVQAKADKDGNWQLLLKTPAAEKKEHEITLSENG